MSIFSATLPLLDFYGWIGNSITISTALVNDMRGGIFTPALHSEARKAGLFHLIYIYYKVKNPFKKVNFTNLSLIANKLQRQKI